ncbi:G-type lectin S-receptor-like serine/threonine-protein kinase At5g35370 [Dendrobium catenatum]|uniref:Receptor-like serine/threonine-protein kinase n=1 Tax=Dendrobium catenatum TaxID=906689 RepID=A0A2I0XIC7_9ASPA|nr:G-type lectin S-receptor-like serine/threonine-protein kinase At5g35370 [Dendrobium catenatum]PKU87666.1 G-type lectin S-receptor-like serine/threonine-protein kinase [Dendrobium catenatum]
MALVLRHTLHFLVLLLPLFHHLTAAVQVSTEFLYPNFTASSIGYIEKDNVFLTSRSSTFSAILSSDSPQSPFIFSILHTSTSTVVWSANFASPAPYTSVLSLSAAGLSITLSNGSLLWFTPRFPRPIAALCLLDSGNLILLDDVNKSMWQSFEHPTDTLLSSQRLPVGASLSTPNGDYRLLVTADDVVLLWVLGDQQYWRLSADLRSMKYLDDPASYMAANESGLFLISEAGRALYVVKLPRTNLKFMKLESDGRFHLMGYSGNGSSLTEELVAPISACDLPLSCGALGVCTLLSRGVACNCPTSFAGSADGGCSPADSSARATLSNCATEPSYRSLESGVEYFANKFLKPASSGGNVSSCRSLCTANCSCLAFFYKNSSTSCFLVNNQLGSFLSPRSQGVFDSSEGYIKIMAQSQLDSGRSRNLIPILLPSITVLLALLFAGIYWRRGKRISRSRKSPKFATLKLWTSKTRDRGFAGAGSISDESDEISIPDLPTRFTYEELIAATNNFRTKIGSGGFGEVFKGDLPDKSSVAVKRIKTGTSGIQGKKKEFITEIAVIGSIHHVNLVRLRGFCAEGRRRLLVYDYMDRGSLDQSLFVPSGPVLEWQERMDIAVGVARGLAYLHSGCDRKVIHCDVKPENILLHSSGGVKISDFGMAKLMSTDQSGLFTTMRGTRGYLAPEWLTNSAISDKTDVYSFGLVLLEIIRGRRNWSMVAEGWSIGGTAFGEMGYYPMIALEMHEKGRYLELADPRLEGKATEEELGRVVRVALCCLHEEPAMRPTMDGVAAMLDGTIEVGQPRPEALGVLRVYGRGFLCSGESGKGSSSSSSSSYSGLSYPYISSQEVSGPR